MLNLNAQYESIRAEVKEAIEHVLESQHFIMGPEVESFEKKIARYCEAEHAIGCASGSDALLLSLMALDIGPGDAVITTPFTFFATAGAIARLGATPVFLDINNLDYNLNPEAVELFLEDNHSLNKKLGITSGEVKAIIPVHLYGQMADMDRFTELGKKYNVAVIEDAAQAIGSEYKGKRAGSIGDFGCFSFFPSKNLGGYGDGGMITTNNSEMAERLKVLRLHGSKPKYHHSMVGVNSRLDVLQAAILNVKLQYLDEWSEARREKAMNYTRLFEENGLVGDYNLLVQNLPSSNSAIEQFKNKVFLPQELWGDPEKDGRHIYHQYVIRTGARQKIMNAFEDHNIGYSVYYPVSLHEQECFKYLGYEPSDCPVSSNCSATTLALPVYPELTHEEQVFVVNTIKDVCLGQS